ncbi:MAG: HAD-IC family P-type ATPase, partial [Planctomycetota bacterium]|nr:HAD-IC family P-type ATPase [Planctomycetota bacterium]
LVTGGQGVAEVLATGGGTELGKIGKALQSVEPERTPLQRETGALVRRLAVAGLILCAAVVVIFALTRGGGPKEWKNGLLAGITMAMSILPEEFPVILTIFLALGAWRISRKRVLTRRIPAVETLGAATVLCVDKTGTLTQNRMSIRRLQVGDRQ